MRAVVQRVQYSCVKVDGMIVGEINKGFNVLLGVSKEDTDEDIKYIKEKIINLRVFQDDNDKMNLSLLDIKGDILLISQFTLYGDARKGRRPSFFEALGGEEAKIIYDKVVKELEETGLNVETGVFGADMKVTIENDGPVTILLDSTKHF